MQRNIRSFLNQVDFEYFRLRNPCLHFDSRQSMFEFVTRRLEPDRCITILEFGVYKGESMDMWLSLNSNTGSRFVGFDSFRGLPDRWDDDRGKGMFDTGGKPPEITDPRVTFVKGWFHEILPAFLSSFSSNSPLVIHLDADLYSSTFFALLSLNPHIKTGTLLVFDEFYDRDHEFRAFVDFIAFFRRKYTVLGEVGGFAKVCIELGDLEF